MRRVLWLGILILLCAGASHAIDTAPAFADPVQQDRYEKLINELRCVQCRGQAIADSNVFLAADLRRQVRELMAAGKTDQEILTYMTDRYGEYVLYRPPVTSRTWLLWAAPGLLLLIALATAAVVIVRRSRLPDASEPGADTSS